MSRLRKKAAPIVGVVPMQISDLADLQQRTEIVKNLWREAGPSIPYPTPEQLDALVIDIISCSALPTDNGSDQLDASARAAIKTLLAWCRRDPCDNGLPHIVFRDQRLLDLEAALLAAQPLAQSPPSRAWLNRAWGIWGRVSLIMKAAGGKASASPNSRAVRFTSLALQWVGHPAATSDAISKELRNNPEFRERISA